MFMFMSVILAAAAGKPRFCWLRGTAFPAVAPASVPVVFCLKQKTGSTPDQLWLDSLNATGLRAGCATGLGRASARLGQAQSPLGDGVAMDFRGSHLDRVGA